MDMEKLSTEQKIITHLAELGILTQVGEVSTALKDPQYADKLVTGDGLKDEIEEEYGDLTNNCDHESYTNEEIQEVFDNDNE